MAEAVSSPNSDTMCLIEVPEPPKTPQKSTATSFTFNSEGITQLEPHQTPCKDKTTGEKRKMFTTLSSVGVKGNSRPSSTQTKSIKSQVPGDAAEIESLNVFHEDKNSPLTKARMCMIQVMSMLSPKAKTELTAAVLALDKARDTEGLESLRDSTDKLPATISRAEEVSLNAQLSEYKRETDQKLHKLLQLVTTLTTDQSLSKTVKSSSASPPVTVSKAEKPKATKTVETTTKTSKPSEVSTSKTKVTYASKVAEKTQQTENPWTKVNKQGKPATASAKAAEKSPKITARDRRLLVAINSSQDFNAFLLRNQINESLKKAEIKNLLVVKVSLSLTQNNIVLETDANSTAAQLLKKKSC
ncbi:MAG: hypothetical protein Q9224_004345 [Gallowayella concinna]